MGDRKVVVQGGGQNMYRVSEYNGKYTAYKVDMGIFLSPTTAIGTTRSFEDALSLIRVYSGRAIEEIT